MLPLLANKREQKIEYAYHHWRTKRGKERGFKPPLNLRTFFKLCVCKIYSPSPAPMLIKS